MAALAGGVVQWPLPPLTPEAAGAAGAFPEADAGTGPIGPFGPGSAAGIGPGFPPGSPFDSPRRVNLFVRPAEERRVVDVAPGQGILWSVGPNRTDEGGWSVPNPPGGFSRLDDLVYLVPEPGEADRPRRKQ